MYLSNECCVLRACVNARGEPVRESESVRVHAVRGEIREVFLRACLRFARMAKSGRKEGAKEVVRDAEAEGCAKE